MTLLFKINEAILWGRLLVDLDIDIDIVTL